MMVFLKTSAEIEGFRTAGMLAAEVLEALLDATIPGISTNDLDSIARHKCRELGAKPAFLNFGGYPAAICASPNGVLVHGLPNDIPLSYNDVLGLDIGVEIDGFIGDTAETICVGSFDSPLVMACRRGLAAGIAAARSGNMLDDIGCAIWSVAKERKFSIPRGYGGHGVDRYHMHASPFVSNLPEADDDNIRLRSGMVLCIEPMFVDGSAVTSLMQDGWGVRVGGLSAHCEHTVLVAEDTPVILTQRIKKEKN
jgi:methionyl aminopeptidase